VRVEELIGQRIRSRRDGLEMTQEQLGKRLGDILGLEWSRQAVSAAEKGRRGFTAAELVGIAFALETSVGNLLTPSPDLDALELPRGVKLPRDVVLAAVLPRLSAEKTLSDMLDTLTRLHKDLGMMFESAQLATGEIDTLRDQLILAAQVSSVRGEVYGEGQS
jgi:transcriptional regulator with XRE-family HTH domain